jgi:hypothetical protein
VTKDAPRKIVGRTVDVNGTVWDVYRERPTNHGFNVLFGHLPSATLHGRDSVILTEPLADFLRQHPDTLKVDLPISNRTIWLLRCRLDISARDEMDAWWDERIDDLLSLSLTEFATRHGVSVSAAASRRQQYLGTQIRKKKGSPPFEWTPELDDLLGKDKDSVTAMIIGVSPQTVRYRRNKLRIPPKLVKKVSKWKKGNYSLLGTDSDNAIADRLGLTENQVRYRRQKLKIESHRGETNRLALFVDSDLMRKIKSLKPRLLKRFQSLGVPIRTLDEAQVVESAVNYMLEHTENDGEEYHEDQR